jgi:hypothetical protein
MATSAGSFSGLILLASRLQNAIEINSSAFFASTGRIRGASSSSNGRALVALEFWMQTVQKVQFELVYRNVTTGFRVQ